MSDLKYTEVFSLNGQAHKASAQLMDKLRLTETQRVIIGNDPQNIFVAITWEGKSDYYHLFKDNYIQVKNANSNSSTFYHLFCLTGKEFADLKQFKSWIKAFDENTGELDIKSLKH